MIHTTHNHIFSVFCTQKRNIDAIAGHGFLFQYLWYNLALNYIVQAIEACILFHAGILPASLQGIRDLPGDLRGRRHGGERQHVLHLQFASLSTSMSVEVWATLVDTDPVFVHGPVRIFLLGLGQDGIGLFVGLGGIRFENDLDGRELPHLLRVQEAVLSNLMAKGLEVHRAL
jgi:hypothetical protein